MPFHVYTTLIVAVSPLYLLLQGFSSNVLILIVGVPESLINVSYKAIATKSAVSLYFCTTFLVCVGDYPGTTVPFPSKVCYVAELAAWCRLSLDCTAGVV